MADDELKVEPISEKDFKEQKAEEILAPYEILEKEK